MHSVKSSLRLVLYLGLLRCFRGWAGTCGSAGGPARAPRLGMGGMTVVAALCLACLASAAPAQFERSAHFPLKYQQGMMEATVRVTVRKPDAWYTGTAVCIGSDEKYSYLLSNAHVFQNGLEAHFEVFTAKAYPKAWRKYKPAWVTWWNINNDIVAIRAAIRVPQQIRICPRGTIVAPGTPVLVVGCGLGAPPVCQVGKVTGLADNGDYAYDRGSIGGRSGSPMVTREHGLIGINTGGREGESYAVHYSKIHRLLASSPLGWGKLIPSQSLDWKMTAYEKALLQLANEARSENKLLPLESDPVLFEAARCHAAAWARHERLTGLVYPGAAWNGFERAIKPKAAHDEWMASLLCRGQLLNPSSRAIGVGLGRSSSGLNYYVQMFSTSKR
jgi:hypothetical protein